MKADAPSLSRGRLFATATGMDALRESLRRDPPRRILIVTRTHTGDAVMSTGAVEAIVRRFSGAEIVLETTRRACGVFDNVPGIHARRCRSERFEKLASTVWLRASRPFDLVVLLDDSRRRAKVARWGGARQVVGVREADGEPWLSASVRWDAHGHDLFDSLLGVLALLDAGADIRPRLYIDEAARASADRVLAPLSGARAAGVFVDAAVEQKRWPLDRFVELAARLERSGVPTLATAGIGGHRRLEPFRRAGLRTAEPAERPLALAALFERLQLLVTNDTAAVHLADAVGTPCVILYGPTAPSRFAPFGGGHRFLHAGLECDQYLRRCAGESDTGACDRRCMTSITVDAVCAAAMDVWNQRASAGDRVLGSVAHGAQDA